MTTIVYKAGIIAYDSRVICNDLIIDDDFDKHFVRDGVHFFHAGSTNDIDRCISAYFGKREKPGATNELLVADNGVIWNVGLENRGFWRHPVKNPIAIGSGERHAFTAMDMGADAKTAVKMAAKRDSGTGGKIRTFRVF